MRIKNYNTHTLLVFIVCVVLTACKDKGAINTSLKSDSVFVEPELQTSEEIHSDLSMYPKPLSGYRQIVVQVPRQPEENDAKIELMVGKKIRVDICNHFFLLGSIVPKELQGWGYQYYEVDIKDEVGGTRKACIDTITQVKMVYAPSHMVGYNSRAPIVVYLPDKLELQYRIWKADTTLRMSRQVN